MKLSLHTALFWLAMLVAAPAFAQFSTVATPTSQYTGGTTVMAIPGANFSTTTTLTDGTQTLGFSATMDVRTVPGGGWATWSSPPYSESSTPKVLAVTTALTSMTITLTVPRQTFGFEFEPNNGTQAVSAAFYNGATLLGSIPLTIVGTSGARLFAASSSTPITSVVLTVPAGASGFALAQFRYGDALAAVPIPTLGLPELGLLSLLLLAGGLLLTRRQNSNRV